MPDGKALVTKGTVRQTGRKGSWLLSGGLFGRAPYISGLLGTIRTNLAIKMANYAKHFRRRRG